MTDYIFTVRGTGERYGANMLANVTAQLPSSIRKEEVAYDASLGLNNPNGSLLSPSGNNCATQVVDWLNRRTSTLEKTDRYAVIGYSLGGVGVTRWLNQQMDTRLIAAGNIANPARKSGTNTGNWIDPSRSGIYRMFQKASELYRTTTPPLFEVAHPRDVMTSCPERSPLPEFAGPVMAFDLGHPMELVQQLRDGGITKIVYDLGNIRNWISGDWWRWAGQLNDYVTWAHTTSYTNNREWVLPGGGMGIGVQCLAAHLRRAYGV